MTCVCMKAKKKACTAGSAAGGLVRTRRVGRMAARQRAHHKIILCVARVCVFAFRERRERLVVAYTHDRGPVLVL
jgi:hypothetical protein